MNSRTAIFIAMVSLLAMACHSRMDQPISEKLIPVNFVVPPEVYGAYTSPATRADFTPVDLTQTVSGGSSFYYNGFTGEPVKTNLPEGSTLWMTYRKGTVKAAYAGQTEAQKLAHPEYFNWGSFDLKPYVVRISNGYYALYPLYSKTSGSYLEVDTDAGSYDEPLLLEEGYYQFRAVSPAYKIKQSDLTMQVDNGMYLYSHDERYEQTKSQIFHIYAPSPNNNANYNRPERIMLNPIISQVARVHITLHPGENISRMEMMPQGIEVSGLQNPEANENGVLLFKWNSVNIADTLKMKKADKYSRTYITNFSVDETTGAISGEIGILPTDAMSTNLVVVMNVAVNGIPTQYLFSFSRLKLFHGHSYNMDFEVGLDGNIRVMSWANQNWTGEMKLD